MSWAFRVHTIPWKTPTNLAQFNKKKLKTPFHSKVCMQVHPMMSTAKRDGSKSALFCSVPMYTLWSSAVHTWGNKRGRMCITRSDAGFLANDVDDIGTDIAESPTAEHHKIRLVLNNKFRPKLGAWYAICYTTVVIGGGDQFFITNAKVCLRKRTSNNDDEKCTQINKVDQIVWETLDDIMKSVNMKKRGIISVVFFSFHQKFTI